MSVRKFIHRPDLSIDLLRPILEKVSFSLFESSFLPTTERMNKAPKDQLSIVKIKPSQAESELRDSGRMDIRQNEGVSAEILINNTFVPTRVFDLSSTGICLILPTNPDFKIKLLDMLKIRIKLAWSGPVTSDYQVCWITPVDNGLKVGLRSSFIRSDLDPISIDNSMVPVSDSYPLIGYLFKDFHYLERSIFHLLKLSAKYAVVEVHDKDHIFFPNQIVELLFSVQSLKMDKLKGSIVQIQQASKNTVTLILKIDQLTKSLEADLVNQLVINPNVTLETIRNAGFKIKSVAHHFRFRFVKTQEEYEKVLALRFAAYKAAGKVTPETNIGSMAAPLDHISRILIALHGDKVIASVSLSFPETNETIMDTERPLKGGYPDFIPPKIEMIEVARLCTDPEYRRGDLLLRMFENIYRVLASSDRKYLITSTDKNLWPLYKNLGFKKMGLKYDHPYLAGIEHDVILVHVNVATSGKDIGLLRWWFLYSKMTKFIERREKIERSHYLKIRYFLFKTSAKILDSYFKISKK